MNCIYCNNIILISKRDGNSEYFYCFNHEPTKVMFALDIDSDKLLFTKFSKGLFPDETIIWFDYNRSDIFINNESIYLDYGLKITPENFESKIKSLLPFL